MLLAFILGYMVLTGHGRVSFVTRPISLPFELGDS